MFGQGRPFSIDRTNSGFRVKVFFTTMVLVCVCAPIVSSQNAKVGRKTPASQPVANHNETIRFRISWGGGEVRQWTGLISVSQGKLDDAKPLSLAPDASGSVVLAEQKIHIHHWSPTNYGGVDVSVTSSPDAKLNIDLASINEPDQRFVREIAVSELLAQPFHHAFDETGNRFVISRAPGDLLPVTFKRDHLVFAPGEAFEIGVRANRTELVSQTANCRLRLNPSPGEGATTQARSNSPLWKKSLSMELDAYGSAEEQRVQVSVPTAEGVYDLEIELTSSWQQASLRAKSGINRRVQFVVLGREKLQANAKQVWNVLGTIDPTQDAADNFLSFANLSKITNTKHTFLGNELRRNVLVEQQPMVEMSPGGWQAIPLHVDRLDRPHWIEIEFLADHPTAIGFSILQPDASGQIPLHGFDSGVMVPHSLVNVQPTAGVPRRQLHRVPFWPHDKQPYLLIANRHSKENATVGSIRILGGPDRLNPGPEDISKEIPMGLRNRNPHEFSHRKFMAFFESPLFSESFGARETVDPMVGQPLDDWNSFYVGADRFVQYLKANSYRGAFVTVASEGSSIYPSQILGSSPKQDTGTFFSNGQDPVRKDVLEMLFRMFEREGLTLVPTLAMSGPLPQIEASRMARGGTEGQTDLVHFNRAAATRTLDSHLPIYNPLNSEVQANVTKIVGEISARYHSFESFGGLAIICRPDTYTLLPGQQWGYDDATVRQFWQSQNGWGELPNNWVEIQSILLKTQHDAWIQWRAQQMSRWYRAMLGQLRLSKPQAEIYLAPVDIYRNEELSAAFSPSLHSSPDFRQQMLQVGLDWSTMAETDGLNLLKPQRLALNQSAASNRVDLGLENNRQADEYFLQSRSTGDIYTHRISWAHFAQLEQQNPFGLPSARIMRLQPLTPAGVWNRQRFLNSLRVSDSRIFVDGGSLLLMGQEAALQELKQVFQQLPDQKFVDVKLPEELSKYANATLPVIVRQFQAADRTWFYAANASPWPTQVQLTLRPGTSGSDVIMDSLSDQPLSVTKEKGAWVVRFVVEPMSLVGGVSRTELSVVDYQFQLPDNAADRLRKQVYALQAKLVKSSDVEPISVLKNTDFESYGQPTLAGWDFGQQSADRIQLNSQGGYSGKISLRMQNEGSTPVWIRSNAIEPTSTGRLSFSVWLRTDTPNRQPPLRLAVEGTLGESSYYRFGSVGSLSPNPQSNQLSQKWQRFAVHFDDLPIERLTNLRIGFDLMGPGDVQLDHIEVFDRWFDEQDAKAMTQRLAGCGPLLVNPLMLESCRLLLDSYWLRFLDEQFEYRAVEATLNSPAVKEPKDAEQTEEEGDVDSKHLFRRFRRLGGSRNSSIR